MLEFLVEMIWMKSVKYLVINHYTNQLLSTRLNKNVSNRFKVYIIQLYIMYLLSTFNVELNEQIFINFYV